MGLFSQVYPNACVANNLLETTGGQGRSVPPGPTLFWVGVGTVILHLHFSKTTQPTQLEPLVMFQEIYLKFNLYIATLSTTFGEVCSV